MIHPHLARVRVRARARARASARTRVRALRLGLTLTLTLTLTLNPRRGSIRTLVPDVATRATVCQVVLRGQPKALAVRLEDQRWQRR